MAAFQKSVSQSMPGYGSPSNNGNVLGTAATGSAQAIIIANTSTTPTGGTPFNTSGMPAPSRGKCRVRTAGVTGTFTLTSIIVQDSGGNSLQIAGPNAAGASAQNFDRVYMFDTDLLITQITFNVAASTAVGTIDCEVSMV